MNFYIWGTGCGAARLMEQKLPFSNLKAFVDSHPLADHFLEKPVIRPEDLSPDEIDLILISSSHSFEILEKCLSLGIRRDALFFVKNQFQLSNRNADCLSSHNSLEYAFLKDLQENCQIVLEPLKTLPSALDASMVSQDYVRIRTLELICASLSSVPGAVAELGVYRGNFAAIINRLLPRRRLYLFDTFSGFDSRESSDELGKRTCSSMFVSAHENTSAMAVRNRMPYPENVILCQGLFPDSAADIQESFSLVSLDVDFEESTYAGLCWFWPRMAPGGYLLIHDYNSPTLQGVQNAVKRYEQDQGIRLPGVPLCDINGTLVIRR